MKHGLVGLAGWDKRVSDARFRAAIEQSPVAGHTFTCSTGGRVLEVVLMAKDITERKASEDKISLQSRSRRWSGST